jgi:hypothetical protein
MSEHWTLKIIADSEPQARAVLERVIQLIDVEPRNLKVEPYSKFSRMWSSEFDARPACDGDPLDACKARFAKLAPPTWEESASATRGDQARPRRCYEASADSRKDIMTLPEVFWAGVYCEVREARDA